MLLEGQAPNEIGAGGIPLAPVFMEIVEFLMFIVCISVIN